MKLFCHVKSSFQTNSQVLIDLLLSYSQVHPISHPNPTMAASRKHVLSDDENVPLQPQKALKKMLDV
jgi:hypothetical protein